MCVDVCMRVCVHSPDSYVCHVCVTHTCAYTYIHTRNTHTHTHTHASHMYSMHIHIAINACTYTHVYIHTHTVCVCVCVHACVCVHMCVRACVHVMPYRAKFWGAKLSRLQEKTCFTGNISTQFQINAPDLHWKFTRQRHMAFSHDGFTLGYLIKPTIFVCPFDAFDANIIMQYGHFRIWQGRLLRLEIF